MMPDLSTAYVFKFDRKTKQEVENMMLKTTAWFEFYIPKEESKFEYVIGAVYSEKEADNLKKYLSSEDKELYGATIQELNSAKSLVGIEYDYMKSVYSSFNS